MLRFTIALVLALHGLVHLWYTTLPLHLVPFRQEMGWTGRSWLLSNVLEGMPLRALAAGLFALLAVAFLGAALEFVVRSDGWRPHLAASAVASTTVLVLLWDGDVHLMVEKGLLGVVVNVLVVTLLALYPESRGKARTVGTPG
jgi:hypothetical protein